MKSLLIIATACATIFIAQAATALADSIACTYSGDYATCSGYTDGYWVPGRYVTYTCYWTSYRWNCN